MNSRNVLERRIYTCWAIVEPAPDVRGKWVAHCLDFDTLSQADDMETAAELLIKMTKQVVLEDLREGVNPDARRAPDEDWAIIEHLVDAPRYESFQELQEKVLKNDSGRGFVIGCQFLLSYRLEQRDETQRDETQKPILPLRAQKIRRNSSEICVPA